MISTEFVFKQLRMMLDNRWGYIWGQSGAVWTQAKQDSAKREMTVRYGSKWIGHHVADCSGVMVYIWKQCGLSIPHGSNSMVKKGYIVDISTERKAGYAALVYKPKTNDYSHIGIVAEDGYHVYEAKGTQAGFVYSAPSNFNLYGKFKDVDYDGSEKMDVLYKAEVATKSGSLNIRSGNGKAYPIIFKLPKGSIVDVLIEYADGWRFIQDADGRQGYCDGTYLTKVETEPTPTPEPTPDPETPKTTKLKNVDGVTIEIVGEWEVV